MNLVIVPCGRSKIWEKNPHLGPIPARDAYTGAPFKVNREYAEKMADRWVILSAKYGFIEPTTPITQYEVTFKRKSTNPISASALRKQATHLGLFDFDEATVLGGKEYRSIVEAAFAGTAVKLVFPFSGLTVGKAMRAVKQSLAQSIFHESRRSTRVPLKVMIAVEGAAESLKCEGETIVVNLHGALISTSLWLSPGMRISIHVLLTDKRANARVVYVDPANPMRCGVELDAPRNIWGVPLPPDDWHDTPRLAGN